MKKTLALFAALVMAGSAYAQGTVSFFGFAEVTRPGGAGAGAGITAGLFLSTDLNTPLATTDFVGDTGFLNAKDVIVPGHPVGDATAQFVVRAWETSAGSFANAQAQQKLWGQTSEVGNPLVAKPFTTSALGGANPPNPPAFVPDLGANYTGFVLQQVPEPSTIALGVIGIGALLLRRRK